MKVKNVKKRTKYERTGSIESMLYFTKRLTINVYYSSEGFLGHDVIEIIH